MMFMAVFDYHKTQKMAIPVLGVVIVLLLLVFTPLGVTINNATRWIGVGGATIMPGELAKRPVFCLSRPGSVTRVIRFGVL